MILVIKRVMLFPPESSCHQYTRAITYSYFCFLQEITPYSWPFQVIKHLTALFLLPLMLLEQTANFALLTGQQPFWTTLVLTCLWAVHAISGHQLLFYRFIFTTALSSKGSIIPVNRVGSDYQWWKTCPCSVARLWAKLLWSFAPTFLPSTDIIQHY